MGLAFRVCGWEFALQRVQNTLTPDPSSYSCRSATIGSTLTARRAGR